MLLLALACDAPDPASLTDLPPLPTSQPEPGWYALPALPHPIQEHAVVSVDGEVWVIGGVDASTTTLDEIWIFDGEWRAGPTLPLPLHHPNVTVIDGDLFLLGGLSTLSFTPTGLAFVLRNGASEWEELAPLPEPRGASAVAAHQGGVAVIGGLQGGTVESGVWWTNGIWQTLEALPAPRDHAAAFSIDDRVMVIGGRNNGIANVAASGWSLDDGWQAVPDLITARAGVAAAKLDDDRLIVAGGEGNPDDPDGVFAEVEMFVDGAWTSLDPMPLPVHGAGGAAFEGGFLVPGGADVRGFRAIDTVQLLIPPSTTP